MGEEIQKEINKIFSKNLIYWLQKREKTQADLYKKMNVSSATASDWCNEKKIPRVDKLVIIAKWLNIEISDLLEQKEYNDINFRVSELEKQIIIAYRKTDEIGKAVVLRSLGINEESAKNKFDSRVG